MIETDVLIIGAGPAGAAAALNLAPIRNVLLVERRPEAAPRIGDSLIPAARRLFADMGLLASFETQGHAPCFGNRSVWGSPTPGETDFLRDPDGPGWHLDRARFDAWLRAMAVMRGAQLVAPARIETIEQDAGTWRVTIAGKGRRLQATARVVIEAGGRAAHVAHRLGARRQVHDRLVCAWVHGRADPAGRGAGFSFVEAAEHGWWYSAPLPGRRRVLAFHTDADLPAAQIARSPPHYSMPHDRSPSCPLSCRIAVTFRTALAALPPRTAPFLNHAPARDGSRPGTPHWRSIRCRHRDCSTRCTPALPPPKPPRDICAVQPTR